MPFVYTLKAHSDRSLCSIAAVLCKQDMLQEAMSFFSQALAIYEATYGPNHAKTQQASKALQMVQQLRSAPPSPSTPRPTQQHIRVGTHVRACGLVSAPQHNGCRGVVTSFDGSKQRYAVRLDSSKVLSLRPACVLQLAKVELSDAGQGIWLNMWLDMCLGMQLVRFYMWFNTLF